MTARHRHPLRALRRPTPLPAPSRAVVLARLVAVFLAPVPVLGAIFTAASATGASPRQAADETAGPAAPAAPAALDEEFLRTASPEALYNEGVRRFRAGDLGNAGELFRSAAARGKASTAASAMYNRGTARYAEAMQALAAAGAGGVGEDAGAQLISALEASVRDFKDAIRADPTNTDARANAELAHRVLKELRQQQQQQQGEGSEDQERSENQEQQQQDGQQREQQAGQQDGKNEEQKEEQKQEQSSEQSPEQRDEQHQGQDSPREAQSGEQTQPKQNQPSPQAGEQEMQSGDEQLQDPPKDAKNPPQEAQKPPLTKQEVERLLQKIRDRERQRIFERMQRQRSRVAPAPRDW